MFYRAAEALLNSNELTSTVYGKEGRDCYERFQKEHNGCDKNALMSGIGRGITEEDKSIRVMKKAREEKIAEHLNAGLRRDKAKSGGLTQI